MTTTLSKADYLQRYLSGGDNEEKKKKKRDKSKAKPTGMRIVEDDAFLSVSIAKQKEVDSDEEKDDLEIIKEIQKKVKQKAAEAPKFRCAFVPVEDEKPSSQLRQVHESNLDSATQPRSLQGSDSDCSPPRRTRHDSDSDRDHSPSRARAIRGKRYDSDCSPPRRTRHDSDSDRDHSSSKARAIRGKRYDSASDRLSVRKRQRHDSSQSPSRYSARKRHDSDQSPIRTKKDQSPTHRKRGREDRSSLRGRKGRSQTDSGSDYSPLRIPRQIKDQKRIKKEDDGDTRTRISPEVINRITSPERVNGNTHRTLDGKVAGLQSARDLKEESEKIRLREAKVFDGMDAAISGQFAETIVRRKQIKKGRCDNPEDKERKEREAKKQAELEEKYKDWNKGVKQLKERQEQLEEMARVVDEPLTRTANDEQMNKYLKSVIHEDDPMSTLLLKKKKNEAIDRGELVYPQYQGECPPNRFGIRPGYRWDGVDRSNGFEGRLARTANKRRAQEKEFYQNIQAYE